MNSSLREQVVLLDALDAFRILAPEREGRMGVNGINVAVERWLATTRPPDGTLYHQAVAELEKPLFAHVLERTRGNQIAAARLLGINRNTLRKRLTDLDMGGFRRE